MSFADRALPAVPHLVGASAIDVLRVPVEAVGGVIESVRPVHVQYRPGSDVIVRYSTMISWNGVPATRETLVASSAVHGLHAGAITVTASTADGPLEVGVWRWPFDPVLSGLETVVTPSGVAALLGTPERSVRLDVISYRPTDRAVIRVSDAADRSSIIAYLKVVDPRAVHRFEQRHTALLDAGIPVPTITSSDHRAGVLVLEPLIGPTLRELIKSNADGWVEIEEFDRLADSFQAADLSTAAPLASRLDDGVLHAQMLGQVVARARPHLEALADSLSAAQRPTADDVIHGDLHEAQLIVDASRIVGVLDIDDAGPGNAIDDRANVIARLLFRSIVDPAPTPRLDEYAARLRTGSAGRFEPEQLDLHVAAALVGLATGPFRMQSDGWRDAVVDLVDAARTLVR